MYRLIGFVFLIGFLLFMANSCHLGQKDTRDTAEEQENDFLVIGAMKNVMWKGELAGIVDLDTIAGRSGLYGLGPEEYLRGELLILDGRSYVSRVLSDSEMVVEETYKVKAPFFVYAHQKAWEEVVLPPEIRDEKALERFVDSLSLDRKRPFVFRVQGPVERALIHVQNLPKGQTVSSPKEAHQGQVNYPLGKGEVDIVGFFSTEHKGIFTHHDSNVHMHLITADRKQMGHLDEVLFGEGPVRLYLPVE